MSKELSDEQIVKIYEHCCLKKSCVDCPMENEDNIELCNQVRCDILNLINRLKEENAELKAENERLKKPLYDEDLFNMGGAFVAKKILREMQEDFDWYCSRHGSLLGEDCEKIIKQLADKYGVDLFDEKGEEG